MDCRRRLTCILFTTLVVCAAAAVQQHDVQRLQSSLNLGFGKWFTPNGLESDANVVGERAVKPVNLQYPSAVLFGRTCGGTIISPNWILTAAHCTLFTNGLEIVAGTNNTDNGTGVRRRVKKLHVHPLFSVGPYWLNADKYKIRQIAARWDFLLAELEQPLILDGTVIAAAELDERARLTPGERVGYAGYGAENHGETMRSEMHAMDLEILSDEDCSTLEQYNPQDMLCVKGRPPRFDSACNGDSGSGLISNGRILGVASWVEDDAHVCQAGKKVVFSRVSAAKKWIKQITNI